MLLFLEDWNKYPSAIADVDTPNKSFVRLASVYREMGVKNHAFILALINPELKGIDPHSKDLTLYQMNAIVLECSINPWYFFRECVRVPALSGPDAIPLEANRGNIALYWCFFNHVMVFLIQIRQTGKSVSTDCLMTLLLNVMCISTEINLLTKDDTLRRKNIERIKDIFSELPRYMQQTTKDDARNGEEITIKALKNTYKAHVPQMSAKRALLMGRGLSAAILQADEAPFQPNIEISLPAALAANGAAVELAKKNNLPYGTIITTTAGKKNDKDGKYIYRLLNNAMVWNELLLDAANEEELVKIITKSARGGICSVNITLNHRQLGKTDEWLKDRVVSALAEGDDADRDFFNRWTDGGMGNPLSIEVLSKITGSNIGDHYAEISKYGYVIRWYIPEKSISSIMSEGQYVLAMDTSEASGGDDISLYIMDIETLETIAIGTFNETNLILFSEWVCSLFVRFSNITGIIERRSTGGMLLDYLLLMMPQYGLDPFKRLYNTVVQNFDENSENWKEIQTPLNRRSPDIYVRFKKSFGFSTSGSGITSRSELYSVTLQNAAKRGGSKVKDKALIDQITSLTTRNGRIDHEVGGHDDLVIAWLLGNWFLANGKQLNWYGIDSRRVMSAITVPVVESYSDSVRREEQYRIRDRIEELFEELSNEEDEYVATRLIQELKVLDKRIILEDDETYSIDALLNKVNENKRNNRRLSLGYR